MTRKVTGLVCLLAMLLVGLGAGCGGTTLSDAARQSVSSFAVSVLTTAVNDALGP